MMRGILVGFLLLALLQISGCSGERKEDLKAYIQDVKNRSIGQIEPLPEVRPYEAFTYNAFDLRSPFEPPKEEESIVSANTSGIRPDIHRRKEPLESFALDSLKMVGTMEKDKEIWAIVVDKDGTVHRVTVGNYMGQNHGKINEITEEKMSITEIIPDDLGGWRENDAEINLVE